MWPLCRLVSSCNGSPTPIASVSDLEGLTNSSLVKEGEGETVRMSWPFFDHEHGLVGAVADFVGRCKGYQG